MERRDRHIDAARARLGHLAGVAHRTEAAERKIFEAAQHRLAAVNADLDKLRPRALIDDGAGDRLMQLTQERGTLETVIAQAQHHLEAAAP